ncbi:GNAT family N-acetyltransferase [Streptomyces sp. SID7805]|nr:GNAT family N-acetyltransferase [Streptomyces sp. SID7805]
MKRGTGAWVRTPPRVRIEPWGTDGLDLLRRLNAPEMTGHLGGPETERQLLARHRRYLGLDGAGQMFRVVLLPDGAPGDDEGEPGAPAGAVVGSIGFWELSWQGAAVYETGWGVLPEFQGRGIAVAAAREVIGRAGAEGLHRSLHAFPSVHHTASNAVCRKAGFELMGECEFEYPKGRPMRSHDWRLDLTAISGGVPGGAVSAGGGAPAGGGASSGGAFPDGGGGVVAARS